MRVSGEAAPIQQELDSQNKPTYSRKGIVSIESDKQTDFTLRPFIGSEEYRKRTILCFKERKLAATDLDAVPGFRKKLLVWSRPDEQSVDKSRRAPQISLPVLTIRLSVAEKDCFSKGLRFQVRIQPGSGDTASESSATLLVPVLVLGTCFSLQRNAGPSEGRVETKRRSSSSLFWRTP